MQNFDNIRSLCEFSTRVFVDAFDDYLLNHAAHHNRLDPEFQKLYSPYKAIGRQMPANWKGLIETQYIGHRIFRKNGLIHTYIKNGSLEVLSASSRDHLVKMAAFPWRFSFSKVLHNPAPDFYEMLDMFTAEEYLLFSPSLTLGLKSGSSMLHFNLIGFNGACYQTFGPVIGLRTFNSDDIFFYASECDPSIASDEALVADVEANPLRYMVLAYGSEYPLLMSRGHEVIHSYGGCAFDNFELPDLKKHFKVEYAQQVFRLTHPTWSDIPHFAEAYIDEESGEVFLAALTDQGYQEFSRILANLFPGFPNDPDIRIHAPILTFIGDVLKRKLILNPYSPLFEEKQSPESEEKLSRLNKLLSLALPYVNSGREPVIEDLAKQAGVDPEEAREILNIAMNRAKELRNNPGK